MLELLETRRHLSVSLDGKTLVITGTARSDDIAIAAGKRTFTVYDNGAQHAFDVNKVKTIRIHAGRGDDTIIVSPKLPIRTSIEAGPGNDRVGGGLHNDTIMGQGGDDVLVGNGGNDYLNGGADADRLEDFSGINVIHGGSGMDSSLCDPWELGTGVEARAVPSSVSGKRISNGVTELRKEDGRVVLIYKGFSPSINDAYTQSGPTKLADDRYEVRTIIDFDPFLSAVGDFEQRWDVTDQLADGIIFTRVDNFAGRDETVFSLPFLLPIR